MEYPQPDGFAGVLAVAEPEPKGQQQGYHCFGYQGDENDAANHPGCAVQVLAAVFRHGLQPRPETEPSDDGKAHYGRERHDTQSAHLDQDQDHHMSKRGPVHVGFNYGQSGDA